MNVRHLNASSCCITWPRTLCPPAQTSLGYLPSKFGVAWSPLQKPFSKCSSNKYSAGIHPKSHLTPEIADFKHLRPPWRDRQLDDIVPGDLTATLEAHRESNLRNRIKFIPVGPVEDKQALLAHDVDARGSQSERNANEVSEQNNCVEDLKETSSLVKFQSTSQRTATRRQQYTLLQKYESAEPCRPWESNESSKKFDRRERLNSEIGNFANWIVPNESEKQFRELLGSYLCHYLKDKVQDVTDFEIYGSQQIGLATAISDIDIRFTVKSLVQHEERGPSVGLRRPQNRRDIYSILRTLREWLVTLGCFDRSDCIEARLPLVRLRHQKSSLETQLVYDYEKISVADKVQRYLTEHPQIGPVYFLVKMALHVRSLGEPQLGGLGSFPLLMMIVASFKFTRLSRHDDLVEALQSFLCFYEALDTQSHCLSVDPPFIFRKRGPFESTSLQEKAAMRENAFMEAMHEISFAIVDRPWQLCLQNPTHPTKDLGKACHKYLEVKSMISSFAAVLKSWLDEDLSHKASDSPMLVFFGNALDDFQKRRTLLSEFLTSESGHAQIERMQDSLAQEESPHPGYKVLPIGLFKEMPVRPLHFRTRSKYRRWLKLRDLKGRQETS